MVFMVMNPVVESVKKLSTKEIQVVAQLSHEKKEKKLLLSIILVD